MSLVSLRHFDCEKLARLGYVYVTCFPLFHNINTMIHRWWHRFIRKRTKPIQEDVAYIWKRRLSVAYAVIAWNTFGLVAYSMYQGKADWAHYYGIKSDEEKDMPPGQAWAQTLGIKNAKVYRIKGFTKVDEYEIVDGEVRKDQKNETDTHEEEDEKFE